MTKSQPKAPMPMASRSRMPRLEPPRAKLAKLRRRQQAQAVKRRLSRESTPKAVEPRLLPFRGAILEGVQRFGRRQERSRAQTVSRRRTYSGRQRPPQARRSHMLKNTEMSNCRVRHICREASPSSLTAPRSGEKAPLAAEAQWKQL